MLFDSNKFRFDFFLHKINGILFLEYERSCYFCFVRKGDDTKSDILASGLEMASQYGLEDVTIGNLAKTMQMSKSGIFGHFQSKENLQLLIISYAVQHFTDTVVLPSLKIKRGIARIRAMINNWIEWGNGLSGGCIFVSASIEYSGRPGPVRDALLSYQQTWLNSLARLAKSAVKAGDFRSDIDIKQFAFELYSLILGFHYYHRMMKDVNTKDKQEKALNKLIKSYT